MAMEGTTAMAIRDIMGIMEDTTAIPKVMVMSMVEEEAM